jgi:hypothetical protein
MMGLPKHVFSARRIGATVRRYLYLLRGSWPRIVEPAYWPTVQMVIWGLVTRFFVTNSSGVAEAAGVLIAAPSGTTAVFQCGAYSVDGVELIHEDPFH